jgi:hypothetical protein
MTCAEAQELITALIDQELGQAERSSLEEHLSECSGCRLAFEDESALKKKIREAARGINAPGHLRGRILSDPRIFPEENRSTRRWHDFLRPMPPLLRPILAFALLLAIALPVFYFSKPASEPIALAALETYDRFISGELPVHRTENTDEIVGQLSRAVGGHFHPMGYDLTAMNLHPVAGLVREIDGRKVLVAIYQGQGGTLFCYTFLGSEEDAPTNAARFFEAAKKMNFYAFSRGRVNAVLHSEGKVICILASEMPMEDLLALTKSKANPS